MSSGRFSDQKILVCGGATGIGAATAQLLASQGASVWIQYHKREAEALELQRQLCSTGASVRLFQADLTMADHVEGLIQAAGEIHGLVHSISAPLPNGQFYLLDWSQYQEHWRTSVQSAYWLLKFCLTSEPSSLHSVVFVLSTVTVGMPPKNWAPYISAKYALLGLSKAMAVELAQRGIRVNCVSPGFTSTPLTAHIDPRHQELLSRGIPMQRLATVNDAAMAIAFLLGPESAFVTGINLSVSGGAAM